MSDDLYEGPSVLAPVKTGRGDRISRSIAIPLLVFLVVFVLVFYVLFSAHVVSGNSMLPTLHDGDRALVTRSYKVPSRGDIIIFTSVDEFGSLEDLVKRVVAVPGDTVSVIGGVATVNGLPDPAVSYIPDPTDPVVIEPVKVPRGEVFVLGDNRPVSLDSRRIGFVPLSSVVGRARFIWAPIERIRVIR